MTYLVAVGDGRNLSRWRGEVSTTGWLAVWIGLRENDSYKGWTLDFSVMCHLPAKE